ncbi:hypothetical protein HGP14_05315 [Rhizobium sp. P32RR-XVIII]|nr:hypothetical protein [Rhizobium sp. P32RR-XVIII]NLS02790.1 hypothetical protein [Rhizobium sp. P32RR-XVIII]
MDDFENGGISSGRLEPAHEAGRPVPHSTSFLTIVSCGYTERLTGGARL